jgi:hypothetical protein
MHSYSETVVTHRQTAAPTSAVARRDSSYIEKYSYIKAHRETPGTHTGAQYLCTHTVAHTGACAHMHILTHTLFFSTTC